MIPIAPGFWRPNSLCPGEGVTVWDYERDWEDGLTTNQTLFGNSNGGFSPSHSVVNGRLRLIGGDAVTVESRFDNATQKADFYAKFDAIIPASAGSVGLGYRRTNWGNGSWTGAYRLAVTNTGVSLFHGTNQASSTNGAATQIINVSRTQSDGELVNVCIAVVGTTHMVWVNGTLYFAKDDSTYTAAGYFSAFCGDNVNNDMDNLKIKYL